MKVCHVITSSPEDVGGTIHVAKSISDNIDSDIVSGRGSGILGILYSFLIAIRLLFSDYDIVHIHDMQGYGYAKLPGFMRKKTVYTVHGNWIDYYNAMPPRSLGEKFIAWMSKNMQKTIMKNSDRVVAVSISNMERLVSGYGADPSRICVIYNGVDTARFRPEGRKPRNVGLFVGDNA